MLTIIATQYVCSTLVSLERFCTCPRTCTPSTYTRLLPLSAAHGTLFARPSLLRTMAQPLPLNTVTRQSNKMSSPPGGRLAFATQSPSPIASLVCFIMFHATLALIFSSRTFLVISPQNITRLSLWPWSRLAGRLSTLLTRTFGPYRPLPFRSTYIRLMLASIPRRICARILRVIPLFWRQRTSSASLIAFSLISQMPSSVILFARTSLLLVPCSAPRLSSRRQIAFGPLRTPHTALVPSLAYARQQKIAMSKITSLMSL